MSFLISLTCCKAKRFLGFLCSNFRESDPSCLSHLYKALVVPCPSWNTEAACGTRTRFITKKIWSVQGFAAKLTTRKWSKTLLLCVESYLDPSLPPVRTVNFVCATVSFRTVPHSPFCFYSYASNFLSSYEFLSPFHTLC